MEKLQLINNKTRMKVFDTFNEEYAELAISICNLLGKFQIHALYHYDSKHLDDIGFDEFDSFASYINKEEYDASSTFAEIVVNEDKCKELCLTELEMLAAIAHEVGHIIFYFHTDRERNIGLEEFLCDKYACRMNLATPLESLLRKLANNRDCSNDIQNILFQRIEFIKLHLKNQDLSY